MGCGGGVLSETHPLKTKHREVVTGLVIVLQYLPEATSERKVLLILQFEEVQSCMVKV